MENYITISQLSEFSFCPYSIYLRNIYRDVGEEVYYSAPLVRGRIAHESVDQKTAVCDEDTLLALPVYSERYGLMGKIDVYEGKNKRLVEHKYRLRGIYQGQVYQLWAQLFCMREMGYLVEHLAFYEISTGKMIPQALPTAEDERQFEAFLHRFRTYNPERAITINPNKCQHCIYCNLCDKTEMENVYQ
jgi:CRISPR-associated protein Cas4